MTDRTRRSDLAAALVGLALLAFTALTLLTAPRPAPDRAQELSQRLRCPVCKSVSVAESPSETAVAMRQAVADQVAAGRTDVQVVDWFRARYGAWVLLDPPVRGPTLAVWLVPVGALAAGVAVLVAARRRPDGGADPPDEDLARVEAEVARARAGRDPLRDES